MIDTSVLINDALIIGTEAFTKKVRLGSICHLITDGKHGDCQDEEGSGFYFLSAKDVRNGKLIYDGSRQITRDDFLQTHRRTNLEPFDILMVSTGATIGRMAIAEESELTERTTFQKSVAILKPDKEQVHPHWLYYQMQFSLNRLLNFTAGSAQKNLLLRDLRAFEIEVPSLPVQRKTAFILKNYDDLIDNNNRRIALLEEAIHRLYREWFVHLRFPGYEHTPLVAGVPEGWEKRPIGDVLDFHIGGGWGKETPEGDFTDPAFVIRGTDIDSVFASDTSSVPFRFHQESNLRSRKLEDGDVVFEVSGGSKTQGVGRTLLINEKTLELFDDDVMCASFCKLMRPKNRELSEYLTFFLLANRDAGNLLAYENQSASNIINFKFTAFLKGMSVLLPSSKILDEYNDFAKPILAQITNLGTQNSRLRAARDALLPRLMNGSLAV